MGGTAVTPNAPGNPFADDSLTNHPSVQAKPAPGNPFADESLTADTQPTTTPASNFAAGSKVPNAILNGSDTTGDIIGGVTLAGSAALAAAPVVDAAIAHLGGLTKIVQAAKNLGWATFGLKEAHDLYKMVSGDKK